MSEAVPARMSLIAATALVVLVIQNSLFYLATQQGRVPDSNGHLYFVPTMVVFVELFKASIALVILFYTQYRSQTNYTLLPGSPSLSEGKNANNRKRPCWNDVHSAMQGVISITFTRSAWKLSIPATLYVVQTNLAVVGAQNLDTTSFVIASQLKFLTTALSSSLMLNTVIGIRRWMSLIALSVGVLLVQLAGESVNQEMTRESNIQKSQILGLVAIICACFISGFASIYLERILKQKTTNMWATNIQLGGFGMIPALLPVLSDMYQNGHNHPLKYFGFWAWTTVWANVAGGFVVAVVMKYADNIQKSLAISLAICLTCVIPTLIHGIYPHPTVAIGVLTVVGSILAYTRSPPNTTTKAAATNQDSEKGHIHVEQR